MHIGTLQKSAAERSAQAAPGETRAPASGSAAAGPGSTAAGPGSAAGTTARLAFLVYLNRSGSTFLARLLAEFEDVAVSLEAQFDDGIVRAGHPVRNGFELDALLDRVLADPKFAAWGADPERLRRRLADGGFPVSFPRFLRAALAEGFDGDPATVHLYKNGRMLERPEAFRRAFPDAKVVFVVRDPRAVHASQRRSRDSRTDRPMSSHAVVTARWFRRTVRVLERYAGEEWLHVVRFEDLVTDPDGETARVLEFLGASARRRAHADYTERIPEAQQHLHPNVDSEARKERSTAWGDELDPRDTAMIEAIAGPEMERCGYARSRAGRVGHAGDAGPAGPAGRLATLVERVRGEAAFALSRLRWNVVTRPRL